MHIVTACRHLATAKLIDYAEPSLFGARNRHILTFSSSNLNCAGSDHIQSKHTHTAHTQRWRTTTRKPPEPIIMMGQSETTEEVRSYLFTYYTLVVYAGKCTSFLRATTAANCASYAEAKNQFHELNRHILTFLHPICKVQGHIQSTAGDASKTPYLTESVRFLFTLTRRRRRSACPECSLSVVD